jgi:hypothetical protein
MDTGEIQIHKGGDAVAVAEKRPGSRALQDLAARFQITLGETLQSSGRLAIIRKVAAGGVGGVATAGYLGYKAAGLATDNKAAKLAAGTLAALFLAPEAAAAGMALGVVSGIAGDKIGGALVKSGRAAQERLNAESQKPDLPRLNGGKARNAVTAPKPEGETGK